jgi:hypothetical protein
MKKIVTQKNTLILFVIFAGVYLALAIVGAVKNYSNVPLADMWTSLDFYTKASAGDWSAWWALHNEHRIVLSRILFWLDLELFKGQGPFLIICNYLLAGSSFYLIYNILQEQLKEYQNKFVLYAMGLVIFCLLFSWAQAENFIWTFQSQFFLAQILPLWAFFLLYKARTSKIHPIGFFTLACLVGVAAVGTMGNGILALPLMVILALFLRMRAWQVVILLGLAILMTSLYFYNFYVPEIRPPLTDALLTPVELFKFILIYLGLPVYFVSDSILATQLAGAFLFVTAGWFTWKALHSPVNPSLDWVLLIFLLYIGGTAVGTGAGRIAWGLEAALPSRYATPMVMAWSILLVLYAPIIAKQAAIEWRRLWLLLIIPLLLLPQQMKALTALKEKRFDEKIAVLALKLDIRDDAQIWVLTGIVISIDYIETVSKKVMQHNLSFFGNPLIKDAAILFDQQKKKMAPMLCEGYLDVPTIIDTDPRYMRISGWLLNPQSKTAPSIIHILNSERQVVGYALTGLPQQDLASARFKGYLRSDAQAAFLQSSELDCELWL